MEQSTRTIADYLEILLRRKHIVIGVFLLVSAAAILAAYLLPRVYRSTATLLMESPVSKSVIESSLVELAEERVGTITQRVMTTDTILSMIRDKQLYASEDGDLVTESEQSIYDLVTAFKGDTDIRILKYDIGGRESVGTSEIAFTISFLYPDPEIARDVAAALADRFIAQNDRERSERAARTTGFLTEEAERLSRTIETIDDAVANYKKRHGDSLPDNLQANLTTLDRSDMELREVEHQSRVARERLAFLTIELARADSEPIPSTEPAAPATPDEELKALKLRYLRLSGKYSPAHPDVVRLKREIENFAPGAGDAPVDREAGEQLARARTRLAGLEQKGYAGNHPDMARLRSEISVLQRQSAEGMAEADPGRVPERRANRGYASLQAQMKGTQIELESLQERKRFLEAKRDQMQRKLSVAPEVEKGYVELIRERDQVVAKYDQIKQKLQDAKLMQALEEQQHGQTLTIIEQPTVPTRPEKAVRRKVALGGTGLALVLGIGTALLLEFLQPRIRGHRSLAAATGFLPLVVIPYVESPAEAKRKLRRRRQRRVWMALSGAACLLVAIFIFGAYFLPAMDGSGTRESPASTRP